ncbi:hypothetical protein EYC84_006766 [Monilinia fructicola]|uniref:Uncharacterized protein n=1 Tax=Monilinia fructicola TaxID=38448 RepID=A0A5M9K878_MONFR|nr:hypothetical protein EYC84_006766 [Monilinia fructicola]
MTKKSISLEINSIAFSNSSPYRIVKDRKMKYLRLSREFDFSWNNLLGLLNNLLKQSPQSQWPVLHHHLPS